MKIIHIDLKTIDPNIIRLVAENIKQGKTVVIPTDTCYGIAIDPSNTIATANLYLLKNREPQKKISYIFNNIKQVSEWTILNEKQKLILAKNLPGQFTFILESNKTISNLQTTIGVRIPDFEFTKMLSGEIKIPYSATSANISGMPPSYNIDDFLNQIKSINGTYPDLIIDAGFLPKNEPSTVVDLTSEFPTIIRIGGGILS